MEDPEVTAVLAWMLYDDVQQLQESRLLELHVAIQTFAKRVAAQIVESSALQGLLICSTSSAKEENFDRGHMSLEDTILRLGQLLCRWATSQSPPYLLKVGVHSGPIKILRLPHNDQQVYYGVTVAEAKELAECSLQDCCVHVRKSTKDGLNVLERLPFTCSSQLTDCYYLEPSFEIVEDDASSFSNYGKDNSADADVTPEFVEMLQAHGVDTTKFGVGHAKTLSELYFNVVVDKKIRLLSVDRHLVKEMDFVHVALRARSETGAHVELRQHCELTKDGKLIRKRERPFLPVAAGSNWQETAAHFLEHRLKLPKHIAEEMLSGCSDVTQKIEQVQSIYFPGILTRYSTTELTIEIENPHQALEAIGLPGVHNFDASEEGGGTSTWCWRTTGEELSNEETLAQLLQEHSIDTKDFPEGSLGELCDELYESRYAVLEMRAGQLVRNIRIIKVWLCATMLSLDYVLKSRSKMQDGKRERNHKEGPATMRMRGDQDWKGAAIACLCDKLGMDEAMIKSNLVIVDSSHNLGEEVAYSRSYPGLKTLYNIHTVKCRIKDVTSPDLSFIGLPDGNDFTLTKVRKQGRRQAKDSLTSTLWVWKPRSELTEIPDLDFFAKNITDEPAHEKWQDVTPVAKRQLEPAEFLSLRDIKVGSNESVLEQMMRGRETNWTRAKKAARRILDPTYTLKSFHDDCVAAFPELLLYAVSGDGEEVLTSSGRDSMEEYQRTMGALFAVFWIMRRKFGGAESFCFGVDDEWEPLSIRTLKTRRSAEEAEKRKAFFTEVDWNRIEKLLQDAGLLRAGDGMQGHDEDRTLAMLVLTAIHDIMKMANLLPRVDLTHGPFCGYNAGDVISDHDIALSYVLQFHASSLPSFHGLPKSQQDMIRFSQCKLDYNMGWLVQAEAPPGALFTTFKTCTLNEGADPAAIAFYFVHWLTDLAGAEPYPQEGCEKFVLKFPRQVLSSFLSSFDIVRHLAQKTETQVFEDYLVWRWQHHTPTLGPVSGVSVAALRLVVMAQGDSERVIGALKSLSQEDIDILQKELAITGCKDQQYSLEHIPPSMKCQGPAILIYYAPALMQKAGKTDPRGALRIMAEVFRQTRSIWPLSSESQHETVTVRIDVLKELQVKQIVSSSGSTVWVLEKTSSCDAEVKKLDINSEDVSRGLGNRYRVLDLSERPSKDANADRCPSPGLM